MCSLPRVINRSWINKPLGAASPGRLAESQLTPWGETRRGLQWGAAFAFSCQGRGFWGFCFVFFFLWLPCWDFTACYGSVERQRAAGQGAWRGASSMCWESHLLLVLLGNAGKGHRSELNDPRHWSVPNIPLFPAWTWLLIYKWTEAEIDAPTSPCQPPQCSLELQSHPLIQIKPRCQETEA